MNVKVVDAVVVIMKILKGHPTFSWPSTTSPVGTEDLLLFVLSRVLIVLSTSMVSSFLSTVNVLKPLNQNISNSRNKFFLNTFNPDILMIIEITF